MIVTAYQANDGKLFAIEHKQKYIKYLKKLATARREQKKLNDFLAKEQNFWETEFWNKVKSIAQLEAAIFKHAEWFGRNGMRHDSVYGKKPPGPPIIKKMKLDIHYNSFVSNSHSCPHNGKTNWGGREKDAPRGYSGLSGRIEYAVEWFAANSYSYPGSSYMWKGSRIHTGSGGGGGFSPYSKNDPKGLQSFGFGIEIFFDEWPELKKAYEKATTIGELKYGFGKYNIDSLVDKLYPAENYK